MSPVTLGHRDLIGQERITDIHELKKGSLLYHEPTTNVRSVEYVYRDGVMIQGDFIGTDEFIIRNFYKKIYFTKGGEML